MKTVDNNSFPSNQAFFDNLDFSKPLKQAYINEIKEVIKNTGKTPGAKNVGGFELKYPKESGGKFNTYNRLNPRNKILSQVYTGISGSNAEDFAEHGERMARFKGYEEEIPRMRRAEIIPYNPSSPHTAQNIRRASSIVKERDKSKVEQDIANIEKKIASNKINPDPAYLPEFSKFYTKDQYLNNSLDILAHQHFSKPEYYNPLEQAMTTNNIQEHVLTERPPCHNCGPHFQAASPNGSIVRNNYPNYKPGDNNLIAQGRSKMVQDWDNFQTPSISTQGYNSETGLRKPQKKGTTSQSPQSTTNQPQPNPNPQLPNTQQQPPNMGYGQPNPTQPQQPPQQRAKGGSVHSESTASLLARFAAFEQMIQDQEARNKPRSVPKLDQADLDNYLRIQRYLNGIS